MQDYLNLCSIDDGRVVAMGVEAVGVEAVETPDPLSCSSAAGSNNVVEPPAVGMIFGTWEFADEYLRKYGKREGFAVVRAAGSHKKGEGNKVEKGWRNNTWKCECSGKSDVKRALKGRVAVGRKGGTSTVGVVAIQFS
ncbi:hypothetical protein BVRB_1g021390 [Beta vulgaris subsp. vulgaris]|nr:hypothetical protein BVRB_1g021390 [Beta vulgaris subsp. vulgaris]